MTNSTTDAVDPETRIADLENHNRQLRLAHEKTLNQLWDAERRLARLTEALQTIASFVADGTATA